MRVFRKTLFQVLCVMILVALSRAAEEQQVAPVIDIEGPTHDFLQVTEGDVVKHDFRVFNRGNAPLEIQKVKPG